MEIRIEDLKELIKEAVNEAVVQKVEQKPFAAPAAPEEQKSLESKNEIWKDVINKAITLSGLQLPSELYEGVASLMGKYGILRSRATKLAVSTRGVKIPVGQEVMGYVVEEGGPINELNLNLSVVDFSLKTIAGLVVVTNSMLESLDITGFIEKSLAQALVKKEDAIGFENISTSENTVYVNVDSLDALTYDDLVNALYSLNPAVLGNVEWFITASAFAQILKMKDSTGKPLFDASMNRLLGYPVVVLDDAIFPADVYILVGSREGLYIGEGNAIRLDVFTAGVVGNYNLIQNDMKAIRAIEYVNFINVFPNTFAAIVKGGSTRISIPRL